MDFFNAIARSIFLKFLFFPNAEESEDVVNQVLDEIGIDLSQAVSIFSLMIAT